MNAVGPGVIPRVVGGVCAASFLWSAALAAELAPPPLRCSGGFVPRWILLCGVDACPNRPDAAKLPLAGDLSEGAPPTVQVRVNRPKGKRVEAAYLSTDPQRIVENGYYSVDLKPNSNMDGLTVEGRAYTRSEKPLNVRICVLFVPVKRN
jgi:hypothetical protein